MDKALLLLAIGMITIIYFNVADLRDRKKEYQKENLKRELEKHKVNDER